MACCGLSGKGMTSMIGLTLFLSFSIVFGSIGVILLTIGSIFSKRLAFWRSTLVDILKTSILKSWNELIHDAYFINPKLKCSLSGKLYRYSPRWSGFVFKYFNIIILLIFLSVIIVGASTFIL